MRNEGVSIRMKSIAAVIFFMFFSASLSGQELQLGVPFEQLTLQNGLTVILHEDHSLPLVSVNMYYHVGSSNEKPGRTGFAHLFEHLMFEGSGHVPEGKFDEWLEAAGGSNNGSTSEDRTNYWENVPANAVDIALFLESDRMGFLLDGMTPEKVDGQRDVVKNERRQSYENQPYGMASIIISALAYPDDHPYHWPVIGSMEDLSAASYGDVVDFFTTYYIPANASLVVAGDFDTAEMKLKVAHWFGDIPSAEPPALRTAPPAVLNSERRTVLEDKVQLPRLYMSWLTPAVFQPGNAELDLLADILSAGKNSRLYRSLVYEKQIAQDVSVWQESLQLSSMFNIVVTARPGVTLDSIEREIQSELDILKQDPPAERELHRAVNQREAGFLDQLQRIGGFGGKADLLNGYFVLTGNPDYFRRDLARYHEVEPAAIRSMARTWLRDDARVVLSVVPVGRTDLAASSGEGR